MPLKRQLAVSTPHWFPHPDKRSQNKPRNKILCLSVLEWTDNLFTSHFPLSSLLSPCTEYIFQLFSWQEEHVIDVHILMLGVPWFGPASFHYLPKEIWLTETNYQCMKKLNRKKVEDVKHCKLQTFSLSEYPLINEYLNHKTQWCSLITLIW